MVKNCPWCNAKGRYRKDGHGRFLEWECGSWQTNSAMVYQARQCENNLLEVEVKRLREELRRTRNDSCPIWFHHELTGPEQYAEDMAEYDRQTSKLCGEPETCRSAEEYLADWKEANESREKEMDEEAVGAESEANDENRR